MDSTDFVVDSPTRCHIKTHRVCYEEGWNFTRMKLLIYPLLSARSQRAMLRSKRLYGKKWGHPYVYEPTGRLLERLSERLLMSKAEVRAKIIEERNYLLAQQKVQ